MKYRLGDICSITKGETGIMKAIPGPYTMVTLGDTNKTHNEYQFDADAVIIPLVSSTGHGHASMRQVKYQEGKFALGNILCAVIPNDKNFVLAKYLQIYLHLYRNELLVSQMKGMANVSLPMNRIADVQVEIPDIEKQRKIVEIEKKVTQNSVKLHQLFSEQKGLASKLKQTILQNAIQGKLTEEWRKEHPAEEPASELLKRIKLEKQQMIASGKLKKEKPLEPIKPEEIPFEIPESWTWCRLGEIFRTTSGGTPDKANTSFWNGNIIWYKSGELNDNLFLDKLSSERITKLGLENSSATIFPKGTLLIAMYGATAGKLAILQTDAATNQAICGFYNNRLVNTEFLFYYLLSQRSKMISESWGMSQPNISQTYLKDFPFPITTLEEQNVIVNQIKKHFSLFAEIENQISESERTSEELLKAIVGEVMG